MELSQRSLQPIPPEPVELMRGKILTPDQVTYLRALYTDLTLALAEVDVSPSAENRLVAEIARAHDCGKRALILELLQDSEDAKNELQQSLQLG